MGKFTKDKKRAGSSSPYSRPTTSSSSGGPSKSSGKGLSGFKMNTNLGQHILKNPGIAEKIVEKANLKQGDIVLEVGPGTGNLTVRILEQARKVIAVEMDPRMAAELTKRVQGKPEQRKLEIMLGDVIKTSLPHFDVCISNTPYQISSPLVFKLLALDPAPRCCVLMFQKEFADRLTAQPGQPLYSRLSANVQMWSRVTPVMKVGKGNFKPPPQVESAVVKIEPKVPRPTISYDEWDGILRIIFSRKNKTIYSNFNTKKCYSMIGTNYQTWCAQNNIPLDGGDVEGDEDVEMVEDDEDDKDEEEEEEEEEEEGKEGAERMEEDDAVQDIGGRGSKRDSKTKVNKKLLLIAREKVKKVLGDEVTDLGGRRAAKCDQGDFLSLLYEFNKEGIHFSGADATNWGFSD